MSDVEVLRMAVFSDEPTGGNPAGVVLDGSVLDDAQMLRVAADIGYSETAFVTGREAGGRFRLRFFSPLAEIPFCGHATLGTAVALAAREADTTQVYDFDTAVGSIEVRTGATTAGLIEASFTSIEPVVSDLDDGVLDRLLALLHVSGRSLGRGDLSTTYPPRLANAGNPHPVVVLANQLTFDTFNFDPAAVRELMDEQGWTGTVTVLHPTAGRAGEEFEARNLFPVGPITEDPATGSAAAATGAYLRDLGSLLLPARVTIRQGSHVGRPGLLKVDIPAAGGITVTGAAVEILA